MKTPSEAGLVSVVAAALKNATMVEEAIESVLAQEYDQLELIIVDDGSTDATPDIVDAWAAKDARIRVVHQENQTLPRALSNGFRLARGEFLSWTSDDNRLKPDFLEKMVACLQRHPHWDMAYANQDIIGDDGEYLYGSGWFEGYQGPPGSPHVYLPENTGELNTWPNNYVGAAFMYRDRVLDLLGDYSPNRFTIEDYDYWMRVNELMNLRHADFDDRVCDYRFHPKSLTSKEKELQILDLREELMVFDDFRRDFALSPLVWVFGESPSSQNGRSYLEDLRARAEAAGHLVGLPDGCDPALLPRLWFPVVYVAWADDPNDGPDIPSDLPSGSLNVLLTDSEDLPGTTNAGWHLCATTAQTEGRARLDGAFQGWYGLPSAKIAFAALDVRARSHHLRAIEDEAYDETGTEIDASVIVCTYRRNECLEKCLRSLAVQTVGHDRYEILLVNNHPADDLSDLVDELREELFADRPDRLRLIVCPLKGLSFARNAGIGEARGDVLCFVDDDAVADGDWLEGILETFHEDPCRGVVGGHILLVPPEPGPRWLQPDMWGFWSHFEPGYPEVKEVENWWEFPWGANWSARRDVLLKIGGFRYGYGRKGDDFGGGEEVVAAALARRIGYTVAIQPGSVVYHHVHPERFTRKDLRKTMRAGTIVNYRMQRDLYIPRWLGPKQQAALVLKNGWRVVSPGGKTTRRQAWYGFRAEWSCLRVMFGDYWDRLRARGLGL
jgi:glycosyltransferase involved in cell wall biosynthesis